MLCCLVLCASWTEFYLLDACQQACHGQISLSFTHEVSIKFSTQHHFTPYIVTEWAVTHANQEGTVSVLLVAFMQKNQECSIT